MQKEITINIPFTYTLDVVGYHSGKVLKTIADMKNEVKAEIDSTHLAEFSTEFFEVKYQRELELYSQRMLDMIEYMKDVTLEVWKNEYFDIKNYSPEFNDSEDERIFNIKLGELLILKEILGL